MLHLQKVSRARWMFLCGLGTPIWLLIGSATHAAAQKPADEWKSQLAAARVKTKPERKEINSELDKLARGLAQSLKQADLRKALRDEVQASKKREQILELEGFLAKASKSKLRPQAKVPELLKAVRATKNKLRDKRLKKIVGSEALDVYFPVPQHRKQWTGGEDLIVAYVPVDDESEWASLVGYSASTSQVVQLDQAKAPDTPVLVVATEEHDEQHAVEDQEAPSAEQPPTSESPAVPGPEPLRTTSEPLQGNSHMDLQYIKIYNDHEPWIKGDPEIYSVYLQFDPALDVEKRDLAKVDSEGTWYWVRSLAHHSYGDGASNDTRISIWERDGTPWWLDWFILGAASVSDYLYPPAGSALKAGYYVYKVAESDDKVCSRSFEKNATDYGENDEYYCYSDGRITVYKHE